MYYAPGCQDFGIEQCAECALAVCVAASLGSEPGALRPLECCTMPPLVISVLSLLSLFLQ